MFHHIQLNDHVLFNDGVDGPKANLKPEDMAELKGIADTFYSVATVMGPSMEAYKLEAKLKIDYYAKLFLALENAGK